MGPSRSSSRKGAAGAPRSRRARSRAPPERSSEAAAPEERRAASTKAAAAAAKKSPATSSDKHGTVPSGHYGNLSADQQQAVDELHAHVVEHAAEHAANKAQDAAERKKEADVAEPSMSLDDEEHQRMLLRFLRARSFKVADAFEMYAADRVWRQENGVDTLLEHPPKKLVLAHSCVPGSHHKFDRAGRPIRIEAMGRLLSSRVPELFTQDEYRMIHAWDMEHIIKLMHESSHRLDREVEQLVFIGDMQGLSMNARKAVWLVRAISAMDELHYPERCGVVFLINCPWVFPALYNNLVKPFLDPVVAQKVRVFDGCPTEELLKVIDADSLPKTYGGNCVCEGGCVPSPTNAAVEDAIDKLMSPQNLTKHKISASKHLQVRVDVDDPNGAALDWFFKMGAKGGDIDFSAHWHPNPTSAPASPSNADASSTPSSPKKSGTDFDESLGAAKAKVKAERKSEEEAPTKGGGNLLSPPRPAHHSRTSSEPIMNMSITAGEPAAQETHEIHARRRVTLDRFGSAGEFRAATAGCLVLRWDNNSTWSKKTIEFAVTKTESVHVQTRA